MIITISGKSGAGKSTAVKALAKLHWTRYGLVNEERLAAEEKGMTLEKFNALGEMIRGRVKINSDDYQAEKLA
jgi:cytidylate kinase